MVADKNIEETIGAIIRRHRSVGAREISHRIYVHPENDSGCYHQAHDFLRPFCRQYRHALVAFDLEGSGREELDRIAVEAEVENRLSQNGWPDERATAIVMEPELEAWVWGSSPHVPRVLGWAGRGAELDRWLDDRGFEIDPVTAKRRPPKEAMEAALRAARVPRSSSIYRDLAGRVSMRRCSDPAFVKLTERLRRVFS